jgi:hypothetical protein
VIAAGDWVATRVRSDGAGGSIATPNHPERQPTPKNAAHESGDVIQAAVGRPSSNKKLTVDWLTVGYGLPYRTMR